MNMNFLKQFLEASTIHGLVYISSERRLARLFWTLIVITGFSIAGYLINDAFANWSESPIKTTIETRPISEITFPKVTVCPPKNKFTDLNYDLMMLENMTLTNKTTQEFLQIAELVFLDSYFENEVLVNMSKLEEENRLFNWYHGYTEVRFPYWSTDFDRLIYDIQTSATTGSIKTQYFADKYDPSIIERKVNYKVSIHPPEHVVKNPNFTLKLEIEIVLMSVSGDSQSDIYFHYSAMDAKKKIAKYNIPAPDKDIWFSFINDLNQDDINANTDLEKMPGFRITWHYSEILEPDNNYIGKEKNSIYKRIATMIDLFDGNFSSVWKIIRENRLDFTRYCNETEIPDFQINEQVYKLKSEIGHNEDTSKERNISLEVLENAEMVLLYISFCYQKSSVVKFLEDLAIGKHGKKEKIDAAMDRIHEAEYEKFAKNVSKLEEENRFYNWYHGYTQIDFPAWDEDGLNYWIATTATTGSIKTQYYGDKYDPDNLEGQLYYMFYIHPPANVVNNPDYTLTLEIQKVSVEVPEDGDYKDAMYVSDGLGDLDAEQQFIRHYFYEPDDEIWMELARDVNKDSVLNLKKMPGFKISWSYNLNGVKPYDKFGDKHLNSIFRRLVNIKMKKDENIWAMIKKIRMDYLNNNFTSTSTCSSGVVANDNLDDLVSSIEEQLDIEKDLRIYENVTEKELKVAGEMFFYLSFCPPKVEMDLIAKEINLTVKVYSPKEILIVLNRMLHADQDNLPYKREFKHFFDKIKSAWNLKFRQVTRLTKEYQCDDKQNCQVPANLLENPILSRITNHPVHVFDEDRIYSPSSFIPFCWFGRGNQNNISTSSHRFKAPVCNGFQPKLRNDQVCYEIDPNEYLHNNKTANNNVLYLIIDENKDRQIVGSTESGVGKGTFEEDEKFMMDDVKQTSETILILDTIDSLLLTPGWKFNLNDIKHIKGSPNFLSRDDADKDCQMESFDSCTTRNYVENMLQKCGCMPISMRTSTNIKIPLCPPSKLQCVQEVPLDHENCRKSCEGLYITSYFKSRIDGNSFLDFWSKVENDYKKYKSLQAVDFPDELKGYEWKDEYKIIGIYIDTPAFDEVTKDVAATFTDQLSTIGGTFGLFTGFSLISGVEILFFLTKFLMSLFRNKRKN